MEENNSALGKLKNNKKMSDILVVEDDLLTLDSIVDLLEAEDFKVTGVTDGELALQKIASSQFDLVICDLLLPNVNGYEVLSSLRRNAETADIPFIILTGKNKSKDISLGLELGVNDYIIKPFLNQDLIKSIQTQLEKKKFLERCYQAKIKIQQPTQQQSQLTIPQNNQFQYPLYYDRVTNLSNQLSLRDKFDKIVSKYAEERIKSVSSQSQKKTNVAVCCIGLEGFERISNSLNRKQRDSILQIAAQRSIVAIGDRAKIVRLPGNFFAAILPYVKHLQQAIEIIRIAQSCLDKPFTINARTIRLKSYIGISFYPDHGTEIENLLGQAQKAVEQAKQNDEDCYEIYRPDLETPRKFKSLALMEDLQSALPHNELYLDYQPQIDLMTGKAVGCEALLRWHHPRRGKLSPQTFIPIAEDIGLIELIETQLFSTACRKIKKLHLAGHRKLKLAINLSASQLHRHDLIALIKQTLNKVQLAPEFLAIELTENILLQDKKRAIEKLSELKSLGINIVLDNFGTGYTSLSYLEQFPFNVLKVDLCYLDSFLGKKDSRDAIAYIVKVARRLNVKVIMEKVETKEQLDFLRQHHFAIAQGYFLSPPLAFQEFKCLLAGKSDWLSTVFSFPPI